MFVLRDVVLQLQFGLKLHFGVTLERLRSLTIRRSIIILFGLGFRLRTSTRLCSTSARPVVEYIDEEVNRYLCDRALKYYFYTRHGGAPQQSATVKEERPNSSHTNAPNGGATQRR